jgi:hypothetical protein
LLQLQLALEQLPLLGGCLLLRGEALLSLLLLLGLLLLGLQLCLLLLLLLLLNLGLLGLYTETRVSLFKRLYSNSHAVPSSIHPSVNPS